MPRVHGVQPIILISFECKHNYQKKRGNKSGTELVPRWDSSKTPVMRSLVLLIFGYQCPVLGVSAIKNVANNWTILQDEEGAKNDDGTEQYASPICIPWNENLFGFKYVPLSVTLAGWGFTSGNQRENHKAGRDSSCLISKFKMSHQFIPDYWNLPFKFTTFFALRGHPFLPISEDWYVQRWIFIPAKFS